MHQCSMCPFFCKQQYELITHLLRRHRNDANFKVHCSTKGCGTTFKSYNAFQMHCKRKHSLHQNKTDDDAHICDDNETEDNIMDCVSHNSDTTDEQKVDAHFILKMTAEYHLSQTAISNVILSTRCLFNERLEIVKNRLKQALPVALGDINLDEIFHENLFQGLDTEYSRDKFISDNFGYIEPTPVKLGMMKKQIKQQGKYMYVERDVVGYFVPFLKQLERLLAMKEVQDSLKEEIKVSDKFTDFYDGKYMNKPFFQNTE